MLDQSQTDEAIPKLPVKTPPVVAAEASASSPAKAIQPTFYEAMDRTAHAGVAKATSGLAPSVLGEAWMDWAVHLTMSPGKQLQLMESALRNGQALCAAPLRIGPVSEFPDTPSDRRFPGDGLQKYPLNVWSQAHLQNAQWWRDAMTGVRSTVSGRTVALGNLAMMEDLGVNAGGGKPTWHRRGTCGRPSTGQVGADQSVAQRRPTDCHGRRRCE